MSITRIAALRSIVAVALVAAVLGIIPASLCRDDSASAAEDDPPLYAGARRLLLCRRHSNTTVNGHTYVVGQMYVECASRPNRRIRTRSSWCMAAPVPAPPIRGRRTAAKAGRNISPAAATRSMWWTSPAADARAIWRRPTGRKRSPIGESGQRRYLQQEKYKLWPQAHLHTQWPGNGTPDDPVTLQMTGSYVPEMKDFTKRSSSTATPWWRCSTRSAPRIIMVHSQAGAFAWPVADARPESGEGDRRRRAQRAAGPRASNSSARPIGSRRAGGAALRRDAPCRSPMRPPSRTLPSFASCRRTRPTRPTWCAAGSRPSRRGSCPTCRRCRSW